MSQMLLIAELTDPIDAKRFVLIAKTTPPRLLPMIQVYRLA